VVSLRLSATMGQATVDDVDVVPEYHQLPTSMQCLRDDFDEDAHVVKQSPAPKQWAARKGAVDDDELWALEKEWGRQHGFQEGQLNEIENVLDLMAGRTIPAQAMSGGILLDRGSFGEIFSATLHFAGPPPSALPIAVKRVDQNSTPEGTTMPQVCCPIQVTSHAARWASLLHRTFPAGSISRSSRALAGVPLRPSFIPPCVQAPSRAHRSTQIQTQDLMLTEIRTQDLLLRWQVFRYVHPAIARERTLGVGGSGVPRS